MLRGYTGRKSSRFPEVANVFLSPTSDLEQVHIDGTRLITLKFICTPNFDKISQSTAENK